MMAIAAWVPAPQSAAETSQSARQTERPPVRWIVATNQPPELRLVRFDDLPTRDANEVAEPQQPAVAGTATTRRNAIGRTLCDLPETGSDQRLAGGEGANLVWTGTGESGTVAVQLATRLDGRGRLQVEPIATIVGPASCQRPALLPDGGLMLLGARQVFVWPEAAVRRAVRLKANAYHQPTLDAAGRDVLYFPTQFQLARLSLDRLKAAMRQSPHLTVPVRSLESESE